MTANRAKMKKAAFYILMICLTFAFCFFVLEYLVARFYYSDVYLVSTISFDPLLGWRLEPGSYRIKPWSTFRKNSIYINKYCLRNREISEFKDEGTVRIIVLGDSFVFGKAIGEEEIFTSQLEEILNRHAQDKKYEIINAGVPGYGNGQELMLMRELAGKNITGDIYILSIFTNDILDNLRRYYSNMAENTAQPGYVLGSNGKILLKHLPENTFPEISEEFRNKKITPKRTRIYEVLRLRLESFFQTKPGMIRALNRIGITIKFPWIPGLLNSWYVDDILEEGIPLTKEIIREIKNEAIANNSKLLVCFIPSQIQVYPDTYGPLLKKTFPDNRQVDDWLGDIERPQRIMGSICEELEVPFLDTFPALFKNNKRRLYIPREGHLNEKGHAVVAQSVADFIIDNAE